MQFQKTTVAFIVVMCLWGVFSLIIGIEESDLPGIAVSILSIIIGIIAAIYMIEMSQRNACMEMAINTAFENGLYKKLSPLLSSIADVSVDIKDIYKKIDKINYTGNPGNSNITPPSSTNFSILKSIFLLNLSLAVVVFLSLNPLAGTHYILTVVYAGWWLFITSEFKLFDNAKAWYFCFAIVILIPTLTVLLNSIFNMRIMMGILFTGIAVFAVSYYVWANYKVKGELPFNIHNDIKKGLLALQKDD